VSFYLPRADAERFKSDSLPPEPDEPSPFSRPRVAPPLSVPPPTDSGVEPDYAPNVSGWEPQPMGATPYGQSYDEPTYDPSRPDPSLQRTPGFTPLELYQRTQQGSLGFFTGNNPVDSALRAYRGVEGEQFSPYDLGFVRNMEDGAARDSLARIEGQLVDPINIAFMGQAGAARALLTGIGAEEATRAIARAAGASQDTQDTLGAVANVGGNLAGPAVTRAGERLLGAADRAINPANLREAAPEAFQFGRGQTAREGGGFPRQQAFSGGADVPDGTPMSARERLADYKRKAAESQNPTAARETITPANDTVIGKNAAGETIYRRDDGSVYRMRNDSPNTRPEGYPDFGGDLAVVGEDAAANAGRVDAVSDTAGVPPRPPTPPAPTPADGDAVQALRDALSNEIETRNSGVIAEEIAKGRARQAGGIAGNLESTRARNATLDERIAAGLSGARRPGGLRESLPQPLELTQQQQIALANQLEDALDSPFDKLNGLKSLDALIRGENVQPAQLKLLQRVFGEEIAELVTTSGRISPRAVLDDAANSRIASAAKFSEKQIANLEERAQAQFARAAELQEQLNMSPTNSRLKRVVQQARQAGEYAQAKADELLARRTQTIEGIPDDPLEALAQQKTVYTAMDKLREAERLQRTGAELAPDQQALIRTKEIVGRKLAIASEPAKSVINVVDELIRGDKAVLEAIKNDRPFLSGARAFVTGDLPDSFLTAALHRRALARSVLERQGVQGEIAQKMANILFDDQLKAHYGGTVPQEIKDILSAAMRAGAGRSDAPGTISTFVQRFKNTQFGVDLGVGGVQGLNAIRRGPIPFVAGVVNRTLGALHLPHVAVITEDADIDRLTQFAIDGLHMGTGPSSARPEVGTLLSYGGKAGQYIDDKVLLRQLNALNELQFGKILGGIRQIDHEGNLAIYKLLGRDITDPKVRAIAADNANTLTSFARSAVDVNRRNIENTLLTSPSMTRARFKSIVDMAKLLSPSRNVSIEERINAATMIAGTYVVYATIGKWVNDQIGVADFELDPAKPNFGVITSQFKDKQGRNIKIDIIPQDAVERAFAQSIRALTDPSIDDLQAQRAWERVLLGSGSIVTRGVGALGFRTGYEAGEGYKYGNLSGSGIAQTFNPLPPVAREVGGSNTPLETGLSFLGVSNYPTESSGSSRARPSRAPRPSRPKRPTR